MLMVTFAVVVVAAAATVGDAAVGCGSCWSRESSSSIAAEGGRCVAGVGGDQTSVL